jgi:ectoine hydroxylase-related dioxygenase (phytanoyl-CoA dioxygenase family)
MVTTENVRQYKSDGYAICRGLLDSAEMSRIVAYIDAFVAGQSMATRPEHLDKPHVWEKRFLDLCAHPAALDAVEAFIGPNIVLFSSHLICKAEGDGLEVPWHQDGIYWPLEPMNVVTLWLAIDNSTIENGCMRVIPRTHTLGPLEHVEDEQPEAKVLHRKLRPDLYDESDAVNIELKPGDCSFHAPYLIHGSAPNRSPHRRCGLTMRFMPAETRMLRTGPLAKWFANHPLFLLRGEDRERNNVYANA